MISIPRATARAVRAVARACVAGRPRGPAPHVLVRRSGGTLTLVARVDGVAVALAAGPQAGPDETIAVPMAVLAAAEGGGRDAVELTAISAGRGEARWADRGVPRALAFDAQGDSAALPPTPDAWSPPQDHLLAALHACGRAAGREPSRFALHRVQLRGRAGEVVGTDGKAALTAAGFAFPFADDVLLPAVPAFGTKELAGRREVRVGRTPDHVAVEVGPWTVWLPVDGVGRYPDVAGVTPRGPATVVGFDDADALALLDALPGLPGATDDGRPVTIDLDGTAAVRAGCPGERVAEVRLSRSPVTGPPVRVALDRAYLARAVRLGCRTARVSGPLKPVVFEGGPYAFVAMTLGAASAVEPSADAAVVSTDPVARVTPTPMSLTPPVTPRSEPMKLIDTNGHAADPPPNGTFDPLAEAEALRALFAEGAARATRLVAALRHRKREQKALTQAWSSLKSLNLGTE